MVTGAVTRDVLLGGAPVVTLGMYSDNEIARRMYLRLGFRCDHHWSSYGILRR
jgi:predicted GNAT family acetyltransferase